MRLRDLSRKVRATASIPDSLLPRASNTCSLDDGDCDVHAHRLAGDRIRNRSELRRLPIPQEDSTVRIETAKQRRTGDGRRALDLIARGNGAVADADVHLVEARFDDELPRDVDSDANSSKCV